MMIFPTLGRLTDRQTDRQTHLSVESSLLERGVFIVHYTVLLCKHRMNRVCVALCLEHHIELHHTFRLCCIADHDALLYCVTRTLPSGRFVF